MVKTPTLDALAHDGVVFERAISQVPLTWPSHAVILTGTYPFKMACRIYRASAGFPISVSGAGVQQAGYATGAVVSAFVLDRSWGLARGFDFYDDAFAAETFEKRIRGSSTAGPESVAHAITWLKENSAVAVFSRLHLYDPHSPYDPPEPYRSEYKSHLYDGEIAYADHELGSLIAWLKLNDFMNPRSSQCSATTVNRSENMARTQQVLRLQLTYMCRLLSNPCWERHCGWQTRRAGGDGGSRADAVAVGWAV